MADRPDEKWCALPLAAHDPVGVCRVGGRGTLVGQDVIEDAAHLDQLGEHLAHRPPLLVAELTRRDGLALVDHGEHVVRHVVRAHSERPDAQATKLFLWRQPPLCAAESLIVLANELVERQAVGVLAVGASDVRVCRQVGRRGRDAADVWPGRPGGLWLRASGGPAARAA